MLKNYLITTYRTIIRNKVFSLINIGGLTIGMAACILIAQYVVFEKSYDRFHSNFSNIYRLINIRHYPTHSDESAGAVVALGPALKEMFPEVKEFARCYKSERVFSVNNNPVYFTRVFGVDSTFLKIFSFPIVKGNSRGLLSKPNTAVLTQSAAKALFGSDDAVGKPILQGENQYVVEAIAADVPENSHLKFDILFSFVTDLVDPNYCVTCNNRNTYILLDDKARPEEVQAKMAEVVQKLHPDTPFKREYRLQPLSSIHLNSHLRMEHEQNGNGKSVMALTAVAGLILFIAWLNYINLTTSMAINRSGEVGIRKVNGSTRRNLIAQFLAESVAVNLIASAIALIIVEVAFPAFSAIAGIHTTFTLINSMFFWILLLAGLTIGSLIYGFYPAFIVSSFKPIQALKGKASLPRSVYSLRLGLVFLQFTFSIILISGTITVHEQISYMKNVDLGMRIDQTVVIPVPNELRDRAGDAFGAEINSYANIKGVTYASSIPGKESGNSGGGYRIEDATSEKNLQIYSYYVAKNYFDFLSIEFLAGKGFVSDQLNNDRNTELVINDAARKAFGFNSPEEALGEIIFHDNDIVGKINGVVRDHHNMSLDSPISPSLFQYTAGKGYYLVRTDPARVKGNLALMTAAFKKHYPNYPFQYYFLDEHFNKQYVDHIQFAKVFGLFTLLAILIACLGLSGLSMYVIKLRKKEIAMRKVLGASVTNVLVMLSREYIKLTVAAFVIAAPISFFMIQKWLQNFSYRIDTAWWMVVTPGILILAIALITVSAQSLKIAMSRPTDSLRNE